MTHVHLFDCDNRHEPYPNRLNMWTIITSPSKLNVAAYVTREGTKAIWLAGAMCERGRSVDGSRAGFTLIETGWYDFLGDWIQYGMYLRGGEIRRRPFALILLAHS